MSEKDQPLERINLQLARHFDDFGFPGQSSERLLLAARLIQDAAYALVKERHSSEVTGLFLIAAELENRVRKLELADCPAQDPG